MSLNKDGGNADSSESTVRAGSSDPFPLSHSALTEFRKMEIFERESGTIRNQKDINPGIFVFVFNNMLFTSNFYSFLCLSFCL